MARWSPWRRLPTQQTQDRFWRCYLQLVVTSAALAGRCASRGRFQCRLDTGRRHINFAQTRAGIDVECARVANQFQVVSGTPPPPWLQAQFVADIRQHWPQLVGFLVPPPAAAGPTAAQQYVEQAEPCSELLAMASYTPALARALAVADSGAIFSVCAEMLDPGPAEEEGALAIAAVEILANTWQYNPAQLIIRGCIGQLAACAADLDVPADDELRLLAASLLARIASRETGAEAWHHRARRRLPAWISANSDAPEEQEAMARVQLEYLGRLQATKLEAEATPEDLATPSALGQLLFPIGTAVVRPRNCAEPGGSQGEPGGSQGEWLIHPSRGE